ncbi:MAG: hypothetical protein SNI45_04965 [Rikenellaceae bacterium]
MQEIVTYSIGVVVAIIIGRWLYRVLSGKDKGDCTSCENCNCHKKTNCK